MRRVGLLVVAAAALSLPSAAFAIENYVGTPSPVGPRPGPVIPTFEQVVGKEYTDFLNITTARPFSPPGAPDPGQVLIWDGLGGVADAIDLLPGIEPGTGDNRVTEPRFHVDALANNGDALFFSIFNRANSAALLVSHTGDGPNGVTPLYTSSITGVSAVWATDRDINDHDQAGLPNTIRELDGLEVWGGDGVAGADSNRFSLYGDTTGVSVYTASGAAFILRSLIASVIGVPTQFHDLVDLDALMTYDNGNDEFEVGEHILFSIRPILVPDPGEPTGGGLITLFDGGEIWQYTQGDPTASFIWHGGYLWDTAFDVRAHFGVPNENIDGLEAIAIPEPAALGLLGLSGLLLGRRRRAQV